MTLTNEERAAIRALERLAKKWPKSLWLFSVSGTLHVMKKDAKGKRPEVPDTSCQAAPGGGTLTDQRMSVATIDIENDGGDW